MNNLMKALLFCSFVLSACAALPAQVAPEAVGGTSAVWIGGEFADFAPDFGSDTLKGFGANVDLDITRKIGAVGEMRWLRFDNNVGVPPGDTETQADYLMGGKYRIWRWNRFDVAAKLLFGGVWITFPGGVERGSYFAIAPGGVVDYRLRPRWSVRAGYEYQFLPAAPHIPGQPSNGMQPHGFTLGVEYKLLR